MATILNKKKNQNQAQSTSGQSSIIGGGASGGGATSQGTGWTNLQRYLKANKGQGAAVANEVISDTKDDITKSKADTAAWREQAKKQVDESTRQDKYSDTFKSGTNQDVAGIDQGDFSEWKNLGNYWGAKNASETEGYGSAYKQVRKTRNKIDNLNTYGGQKAALQDTYGDNNRYTRGMGTLDAFIMRGDETGKQALQNFQASNKDFGKGFDTAVGDVNKYIGGAGNRGQTAYDDVMNALVARQGQLTSAIDTRAQDAREQQYGQTTQDVLGQLRDKGLISFGMPANADQYITSRELDSREFATDPELAALNALSGFDDDNTTNPYVQTGSDYFGIDQAGINDAATANRARLAALEAERQARIEAERKKLLGQSHFTTPTAEGTFRLTDPAKKRG